MHTSLSILIMVSLLLIHIQNCRNEVFCRRLSAIILINKLRIVILQMFKQISDSETAEMLLDSGCCIAQNSIYDEVFAFKIGAYWVSADWTFAWHFQYRRILLLLIYRLLLF